MKKILLILLVLMLIFTGCRQAEETENAQSQESAAGEETEAIQLTEEEQAAVEEALDLKHELRFGEDGKFRILVISDVQDKRMSEKAMEQIQTLVDREEPDLVLFGGDNSYNIARAEILEKYLTDMVGYIESKQIPWAHVFGNHDTEEYMTREEQEAIYESFEYCISKAGNVTGVGNYVLPILRSDSDTIAFNVFGLDSGDYNYDVMMNTPLMYDYIHFDQVLWYYETSEVLEKYTGSKVPAMMLFHIPLPEQDLAWKNRDMLKHEGEGGVPGYYTHMNSGLFAAAHDRGDVKIIVNGHVHEYNSMVEYFGIKLCYSMRVWGDPSYGPVDVDRLGGRMIIIDQDDAENPETYLSYVEY